MKISNRKKNYFPLVLWLLSSLFLSSCSSYLLFQKPEDLSQEVLNELLGSVQEPILRPGDRISISIWEHEDVSIGSVNSVYASTEESGKWLALDNVGEVNLPRLGRVKLEGYNIKEASYYLEQLYSKELNSPIINLRVLNHFVTILGEVNGPGKYNIDNEKAKFIRMLGEAQGLTTFANPKKIQLIRITDGKIQQIEIDLTSIESVNNANYFLKPEDIIYVPPRKGKAISEFAQQATPFAAIATSISVLISVFFLR